MVSLSAFTQGNLKNDNLQGTVCCPVSVAPQLLTTSNFIGPWYHVALLFSGLGSIVLLFGVLFSQQIREDLVRAATSPPSFRTLYVLINSKVQHPPHPRATPQAFELLKIGLFKFPPLGAKKAVQMPHQLVLNYLSSKTNFVFNQTLYTPL